MDSAIGKALKIILSFFAPPPVGASEEQMYAWHYRVSTTLACIVVFQISYALGAAGMLPFVSTGFATVEDFKSNQDLWTEVRKGQLDTKLFDTRGRQCAAIATANKSALESETRRLQDTLVEYERISRSDWRIPPCSEY